MKTKLFVGNLSFEASSEELKTLFEKYGPVEEATVVVDKRSGKSKGYGFVQMVESKDAAMALELSGHDFKGREIVVTEADSPGEGQRRRTTRQEAAAEAAVGVMVDVTALIARALKAGAIMASRRLYPRKSLRFGASCSVG